ncbi:sugar phosphate nucleotidyltransferase, partial [Paraclostridium dentum]
WAKMKSYFKSEKEYLDFGKNLIPKMLDDKASMYAYEFNGYWRDVGTIESLWQANMDLINPGNGFNLNDSNWRIYTDTMAMPPQYLGKNSNVKQSIVVDGCRVFGTVENSVLSHGVSIGEGSIIKDSVIMSNAKIGKNVIIEKAMIGEGAVIEDDCKISSGDDSISIVSEFDVVSMELV